MINAREISEEERASWLTGLEVSVHGRLPPLLWA